MRLKEKLKNKGFWVSLISAIVMILQAFGLKIDAPFANEITASILGALVILGIISDPSSGSGYLDSSTTDDEPDDKEDK